jgi:hypothetical protein
MESLPLPPLPPSAPPPAFFASPLPTAAIFSPTIPTSAFSVFLA